MDRGELEIDEDSRCSDPEAAFGVVFLSDCPLFSHPVAPRCSTANIDKRRMMPFLIVLLLQVRLASFMTSCRPSVPPVRREGAADADAEIPTTFGLPSRGEPIQADRVPR